MSSPAAPRRSVALPYQAHTESLHSHRAATAFLTVLMLVFTVSLPVRAVLADDAVAFSATLAVLAAIWSVVVGGRWYSFKSDTRVLVQRVVESAADEFLIHALNGLCFAGTAAFLVKEQAQRQLQVQSGKEMFQKFMVSLVIIGFLDRWHRKATDQFKVPFEDVDSRRAFVQSIASRIPYALVKAFVYTVFVGIIGQL